MAGNYRKLTLYTDLNLTVIIYLIFSSFRAAGIVIALEPPVFTGGYSCLALSEPDWAEARFIISTTIAQSFSPE